MTSARSTTSPRRRPGTVVLALAAGAVLAAGSVAGCTMHHPGSSTGSGATGAAPASPATADGTGTSAPPGAVTSPVSRPPVPGVDGDRYARNVAPGATCPSAGAIGFTAQVRPLHCSTTAADPHLRWRAP